jgi:Na+-translocating ferredoxin:NAD+ oxidoreductase RnfG subunit
MRLQLASLLGRPATGDENALHIYRIYAQQTPLGAILTQRVKGAYGAIEIVLGVDPEGKVIGLRLQRNREPESIAASLQRPEWLGSFVGKRAADPWKLGEDIPTVGEEARNSADAIVQGTRSALILLAAADDSKAGNLILKPHH